MRSLTPDEGLVALRRLLDASDPQVGVVPLNLRQWAGFHQGAAASARLSRLWKEQRGDNGPPAGDRALLDRLAAAEPGARTALLQEVLRAQVSQVLRIPEPKLDVQAPLTSLGMDSLMGLELRNRIETVLGIKVSATLLWTYPTVAALSGHLAISLTGLVGSGEVACSLASEKVARRDNEMAQLDDDGLFALLDDVFASAREKKA
jgi:acyl carrier protein